MIEPERKGRFLNPESAEEIRRERQELAEERAEQRRRAAFNRWMWGIGLIAGAGGMIYMITNGLIDMKIGVWLLAAVAAVCGRGTR